MTNKKQFNERKIGRALNKLREKKISKLFQYKIYGGI